MRFITVRLKPLYPVFAFFGLGLCLMFVLFLTVPTSASRLENALEVSGGAAVPQTVIIDAGHGGEDCGAIGVSGVYEKDLNLSIVTELGRQLSELGYEVLYTRQEDRLLYNEDENIKGLKKIYDLKNRVKYAEAQTNAIFISIHMNSFSDERYSGLQVFYSANHEDSLRLANSVQTQVKQSLQKENKRAIKEGRGLYLMENLHCPAILIECGFLSNSYECEKLCEKEYQKQLCFSILCGIISVIEDSATEGMKI